MLSFRYLYLIAKLNAYFLALPLVSMKIKQSPDRVIQSGNLDTKTQEKSTCKFSHLNEVSKAKWRELVFRSGRLLPTEAALIALLK